MKYGALAVEHAVAKLTDVIAPIGPSIDTVAITNKTIVLKSSLV
jgi:hypothetical protein